MPTTVVSSTLEGPLDWPDATVVSGDAVDVVARLKEESDVPLRSHGSLSLNRALMAAGLVDRVQVTLFPVISGQTGTGPDLRGRGRLRPRADREPDARRPHPGAHLPAHPPRLKPPASVRLRTDGGAIEPLSELPGRLDGLRVLDLTIWRPGPYATQLLAEHGADVLKVEPPGGDPMRSMPDLFDILGAGKRSIVLDLKRDEDRATCLELAADADVFVESYRPGVADRLGIGYEAVVARNPAIVYCSVSGFGAHGPLAHLPGHDVNYLAYSGTLRPRGGEPRSPTIPISDLGGGVAAAFAIAVACLGAQRDGRGERIDVSVTDVLATWVGPGRRGAHGRRRRPARRCPGLRRVPDGRRPPRRHRHHERGPLLGGPVPGARPRRPRTAHQRRAQPSGPTS